MHEDGLHAFGAFLSIVSLAPALAWEEAKRVGPTRADCMLDEHGGVRFLDVVVLLEATMSKLQLALAPYMHYDRNWFGEV